MRFLLILFMVKDKKVWRNFALVYSAQTLINSTKKDNSVSTILLVWNTWLLVYTFKTLFLLLFPLVIQTLCFKLERMFFFLFFVFCFLVFFTLLFFSLRWFSFSLSRFSYLQASSGYRSSTASSRHTWRSRDEAASTWRRGGRSANWTYWSDDGAEYESQSQI